MNWREIARDTVIQLRKTADEIEEQLKSPEIVVSSDLMRVGAAAAQEPHKLQVAGSNPAPATRLSS